MIEQRTAEQRISDEEFMTRLRARFVERCGEEMGDMADNLSVKEWRDGFFDNEPEDSADEEMSNWTDDGDE